MTLAEKRTHAETVLAAIEDVIEGRATHDIAQVQVGGQLITKMAIGDLLQLKGHYETRLLRIKQQERRLAGKAQGRLIRVQF